MPEIRKPKLVNRGPAGLLTKAPAKQPEAQMVKPKVSSHNKIAEGLASMVVEISSLTFDPNNARLHPERNLEAIRDSLCEYGQVKPIVVRKENGVVIAGNGTLEAAVALGWTQIAVNLVEMTEVQAAGYGLADNRTAELAKWDFEVVARLDKLLQENQHASIGWSADELEVLRAAEWIPPPVVEGNGDGTGSEAESLLVSFTPDQYKAVGVAIARIREHRPSEKGELDQAECLEAICAEWLALTDPTLP